MIREKVDFKHVPRPLVLLISTFEMMPIHWINLDAENGACQGHGTIKNETWMVHQTTTILIPKTTTTTPCDYSEVNFKFWRTTWVSTSKCSLQSCQLHSGDLGCLKKLKCACQDLGKVFKENDTTHQATFTESCLPLLCFRCWKSKSALVGLSKA